VKRVLIDAGIYAAFKRNLSSVVNFLRQCDEIHINSVVLAELLTAFKAGSKEPQNRRELRSFLNSPRAHLDPVDEGTAEYYAHIFSHLRSKGTPIPCNDLWIAATAMQHGLALFSRARHYSGIDGLLVVYPEE
jgi:tRNA(fMet)-specific endonuclease VapC